MVGSGEMSCSAALCSVVPSLNLITEFWCHREEKGLAKPIFLQRQRFVTYAQRLGQVEEDVCVEYGHG
jgi:hypothetical protein